MTYLLKTLGWTDKVVLLYVVSHMLLLVWAVALIMHTKSMELGSLIINYIALFFFGLVLFKKNNKSPKPENDVEG